MGKGQTYYSAEEVLEIIDRFHQMEVALGLETENPYGHVGGLISKYDTLGMPRGNEISDPTYKQAFSKGISILSDQMAKEYRDKINFIKSCVPYIKKQREKMVLHWKLSGLKTSHIAELEGITARHVRRILKDISEKMSEMSVMSEMSNVS
ncbi:hypothetical protein H9636_07175 [Ureibacillus sp. Re31]|uniref:Uncharacterized protein n=1 Tax=Ureibacillus galli TaxID=2762222 RepID=A0ABR8XAU7_9BACL|nr:hypothetical protein [Ureibacillus galli]MBD8026439.1 hypothetical protein [Ureibacillus galli]